MLFELALCSLLNFVSNSDAPNDHRVEIAVVTGLTLAWISMLLGKARDAEVWIEGEIYDLLFLVGGKGSIKKSVSTKGCQVSALRHEKALIFSLFFFIISNASIVNHVVDDSAIEWGNFAKIRVQEDQGLYEILIEADAFGWDLVQEAGEKGLQLIFL